MTGAAEDMTPAEAALALARSGIPVFPCGADKRPLIATGFKAASVDPAQVTGWWREFPAALPAVPCGAPSGLFAVDLDVDRGTGEAIGADSIAALGIEPPTHVVRTRSGGEHWLYRWREGLPGNSARRLPGVDTRSAGGFIIAWDVATLRDALGDPDTPGPPATLLAALSRPKTEPRRNGAFRVEPGSASAWAEAALAGEAAKVAGALEGVRNDTLNAAAFALGQIVAGVHLDQGRVEAELAAAAAACGLQPGEAAATIASGMTAGGAHPRGPQPIDGPRPKARASGSGGDPGPQPGDPGPQPDDPEPDTLGWLPGAAETDPTAPFQPEVLAALAALRRRDLHAFEALRLKLKRAGCRVSSLDDAVGAAQRAAKDARTNRNHAPAPNEGPPVRDQIDPDVLAAYDDLSDGDLANDLCARSFNANARYVALLPRWFFWDGKRWVEDERLEHYTRTDKFLRARAGRMVARAEAQGDPEKLAIAKRAAKALKSATKSHAVVSMCQRTSDVPAVPEQFDADLMLLGTPGGTVDLATGTLRKARRGDFITRSTAVAPAPRGTPAPLWLRFLGEVFEQDGGMIAFVQRALGYALTGETRDQKFLFFHGAGRNGKGVLLQTVAGIMGDYARSVSSSLLVVQHGSEQHPTGFAQLRGQRLVMSSEIPAGAVWNEEVLKQLTGGDPVPARLMRGNWFNFESRLTLFISGNSKPRFTSVNVAMRERCLLVPFRAKFTDENGKRDPDLKETLRSEWPAILAWLIEGAVEWNLRGLQPPERVTEASSAYLNEEDAIKTFIEECLEQDMVSDLAVSAVYQRFRKWQESIGVKRLWTQHAMTRKLSDDGELTVLRKDPTEPKGASFQNCLIGWTLRKEEAAGG